MRILLLFINLFFVVGICKVEAQDAGITARQKELLNLLSGIDTTVHHSSWRSSIFKYTASILKGKDLNVALAWFNNDKNYGNDEWELMIMLRSYHALKKNVQFVESGAADKIKYFLVEKTLPDLRENRFSWTGYSNPERPGVWAMSENHTIVGFSVRLLLEELAGDKSDKEQWEKAATNIKMWCFEKATRGFVEYFSTHYTERSIVPLLNILDFSNDTTLKTFTEMAVDLYVAEYTQVQINGFRGGAARRVNHITDGSYPPELTDSRIDGFFHFGKFLFGELVTLESFHYPLGDQTIGPIFYATTTYRPSQVLVNMADIENRGNLEFKSARRYGHGGTGTPNPEAYICAYSTPHYVLSSIRIPEAAQWGPHTTNSGVGYRLSFHRPRAMLGTARDTASLRMYQGNPHSSRAIFQYKNVLIYHGRMDTYEDMAPIFPPEDRLLQKESEGNYRFFMEAGKKGKDVYVGVFEINGLGILEVAMSDEYQSWKDFVATFKNNSPELNSLTNWRYASSRGIKFEQNGDIVKINGNNYPITGWPLFDSEFIQAPFLNQPGDVGVIKIGNDRVGKLILDFRDLSNPVKRETPGEKKSTISGSKMSGLVGYYKFEEKKGNTIIDHSGRNNHGVVIGKAKWKRGKYGKGIYLDGYSKISLGDRTDFHFQEPEFTVMAWVKPEIGKLDTLFAKYGSEDYHWTLFSDRNSWAGKGYNIAFFSSKTSGTYSQPKHFYTIESVFSRTKPGGDNRIETWHDPDRNISSENSIEIVDGKWHHIAVRISRNRANRAIFVDGVRREYEPNSNMVTDFYEQGTGEVIIGGFQGKVPGFWEFRGMMDEVKYFNHLLGDEEIRKEMEGVK